MKKLRYIALTMLSALTLTSCSLFSDADIEINNKFNPKGHSTTIVTTTDHIGDVYGTKVSDVPNATVFKSVVYSNLEGNKIRNTFKTASPYEFKYNVNGGSDYNVNKDNNNVDIYVPDGLNKSADQNVVLFIHGGAWISGLKTQVNPYVKKFANEGYIAATIEYTLLSKDMDDNTLSIFRNLDEIDACISTIKSGLEGLNFTGNLNLVLGGASSGAHLAMLYAFSRQTYGASPMPIKFLIDAVGPTDINEDVWKAFYYENQAEYDAAVEAGIEKDTIDARGSSGLRVLPVAGQGYNWDQYQTMRIANGMCGLPFTLQQIEDSKSGGTGVDPSSAPYQDLIDDPDPDESSGEQLLSVTHYMTNTNKIPMICAYAGEDSVVGIKQYANLQEAFSANSYVEHTNYEFVYFKHCGHVDLDKDTTAYTEFVNTILDWMATK